MVAGGDWSTADPRLTKQAVTVDVGVTCLRLGPVTDRHANGRDIAGELLAHADACLYAVKRGIASPIACEAVGIQNGHLCEIGPVFPRRRDAAGRDTHKSSRRYSPGDTQRISAAAECQSVPERVLLQCQLIWIWVLSSLARDALAA